MTTALLCVLSALLGLGVGVEWGRKQAERARERRVADLLRLYAEDQERLEATELFDWTSIESPRER